MRIRTRAFFAPAVAIALTWAMVAIAPVAATVAPKVVIIVGPTGAQTDSYRSSGDGIASAAEAAGADVVKVYSPNATYANVRAAVEGANVIVYLGHGNGFPNPYGYSGCPAGTTNQSCMLTDRDNGWGLNMVAGGGGGGDDESNMVYCGGDALRGTLSSSNSRYPYCQGAIHPAPGFVMIYSKACYTPGAGEGFDVKATESVAVQRVRNFSYPVLALGAGAYFATDLYQGATSLVQSIVQNPGMTFGEIAQNTPGYDATAHRSFPHPDIPGAEIWVQQTADHGGDADYWYAYAGDPTATPSSGAAALPFNDIASSPFRNDILWLADSGITSGCAAYRFCPTTTVTRGQMAAFLVRALNLTAGSGANLFNDDNGSMFEKDIDRLATAGITNGCASGRFCPDGTVTRGQMAAFLVRALNLTAGSGANLFDDDNGSIFESSIDRLATAGITSGCGPRRFCPDALITREQMAAFLHRAFGS